MTIGKIITGIVLAAATAGLASGENAAVTSQTGTNRPLRLAFITPFSDIPFFGPVKKGMEDAARQLNVQCEFKGPKGNDSAVQGEMIREAMAQGYDGIAVNILDSAKLAPVIADALRAGLPVVAFNCDDQTTPTRRLSAVSQDCYEAGRKMGRTLASRIAEGSTVLITVHDEGVSALEARRRGIMDGLKGKNLKFETLASGSRENTLKVVTAFLQEHPAIKTVCCTGQSDTEGAGLAVERGFKGQGILIAGFDLSDGTLRLVKNGTLCFSIDQQPYVQGYYPVVQLVQYCRYGIMPSNVDAGAGLVTREEADRILALCGQHYR